MSRQSPILVTGAHRSGTTWVGRTLCQSPRLRYVHEPFNVTDPNPLFGLQLHTWFLHGPSSEQEADIRKRFKYLLNPLMYALKKCKLDGIGLRTPICLGKHLLEEIRYHPGILVKDPLALLSAEWLHREFDFRVVVTIRNPLGFVGSLKKAGWDFDFNHLRKQDRLMEDRLGAYRPRIRQMCGEGNKSDFIDRASLLWNILHSVILDYRESHPEWLFVKHEEFAARPLEKFERIFSILDLEFDEKIQKHITRFTSGDDPAETDSVNFQPRDSERVLDTWKERLNESEISRVRDVTQEIARKLYGNRQ